MCSHCYYDAVGEIIEKHPLGSHRRPPLRRMPLEVKNVLKTWLPLCVLLALVLAGCGRHENEFQRLLREGAEQEKLMLERTDSGD